MPHTVQAAVNRAFGEPLTIEPVVLADPGPNEVRVQIAACAICHSDLSFIEGEWGGQLPAVWGHEAAGVVVEAGPGATVAVGDHVVVTLVVSCGTCRFCRAGRSVTCSERDALSGPSPLTTPDGEPITHGLRTAAFAEQVVVHTSQVVAIPAEIPLTSAALLACGVVTGVGAVSNTAEVEAGASVVIIGCGGVGLNVVQGAAIAAANPIIAVDFQPSKLEMATRFGATHTVDPSAADAAEQIAEYTGGEGADYVFVAVGAKVALDSAAQFVAPAGATVLVGIPPVGVRLEIDPGGLTTGNQRILGSRMGTTTLDRDIPHLVEQYISGRLELDAMVSGTFAIDDINLAIDEVRAGTAVRNVVVFG